METFGTISWLPCPVLGAREPRLREKQEGEREGEEGHAGQREQHRQRLEVSKGQHVARELQGAEGEGRGEAREEARRKEPGRMQGRGPGGASVRNTKAGARGRLSWEEGTRLPRVFGCADCGWETGEDRKRPRQPPQHGPR